MRALSLTLLLAASPALAGELAGVTLPDTVTVGGQTLALNGMGLREMLWIDIYVGGLYLPTPTKDARTAIESDVPKRVEMAFIYRKVGRDKMLDTFREGLARQPELGDMTEEIGQLERTITGDVLAGDRITLDYVPGKGTTISFNGKARATLGDERFMKGIWSIFIGPSPASEKLKQGMLGG